MYDYNYLAHHGVKGMKWGVRRSPEQLARKTHNKQYRNDNNYRRVLAEKATASSDWSIQYGRLYKLKSKQLSKRVAKDKQKTGQLSDRTKKLQNTVDLLKFDKQVMDVQRRSDIAAYKKQTEKMIDKYSDKTIKSIRSKTKNGEEYVSKLFREYSYELRPIPVIDDAGNRATRYRPTRVTYQYIPV